MSLGPGQSQKCYTSIIAHAQYNMVMEICQGSYQYHQWSSNSESKQIVFILMRVVI